MKFFKKLLLSTTAIFATIGSINPVHALGVMKSLSVTNTLVQQPTELAPQQNSQLAIKSEINNFDHSQDVAFLMPHLKEIISIQGQDSRTFEAKQKERAQLLDYILRYKEIRNNQQALAQAPQKMQDYIQLLREEIKQLRADALKAPQQMQNHIQLLREEITVLKEEIKQLRADALKAPQKQHIYAERGEGQNGLPDNKVIIPKNELEEMTAQIKSLIDQITQLQDSNQQLQESHFNLNSSISLLKTSYEEKRDQLPPLHSSSLPLLQSSASTTVTGDEEDASKTTVSKTETSTPTTTETPTPSEETIDPNIVPVDELVEWNKENFIQIALGKRPDNLTSMTTEEMDLWRTFTLLWFKDPKRSADLNAILAESEDKTKMKLWSTWGGEFTTAELEEKFKANGFMTRAFAIKKAISFKEDIIDESSDDIFTYFTNRNPEIKPETESDLVKAYYFRGLYIALAGKYFTAPRTRTEFKIDLDKGIKGSGFQYIPDNTKKAKFETSIKEAEELFENTPWYQLFINQVQQATLNTINTKKYNLKKENSADLKIIANQEIASEEDESKQQSLLINSKFKYETALDLLEEMHKGVSKATTLREIDDALELKI